MFVRRDEIGGGDGGGREVVVRKEDNNKNWSGVFSLFNWIRFVDVTGPVAGRAAYGRTEGRDDGKKEETTTTRGKLLN